MHLLPRSLARASIAAVTALLLAGLLPATAASAELACATPSAADGHEPECNPHLSRSPWSANHRASYAQASSPFPGVDGPADLVNVDHKGFTSVPVILTFSSPYPDGGPVVWASTVGNTGEVVKLDPDTFTFIDHYIPQFEEGAAPQLGTVSGAYSVLDVDDHLHVGRSNALEVYGDAVPGKRDSSIALLKRYPLPPQALCGDDKLVGITMTYDGRIAFATENGVVGVVPRQPAAMADATLVTHRLNADCDASELETVSNSIAADENGGIYVVTSHAQYRIQWDGSSLSEAWRAEYAGAGGSGGGRLGAGSGSKPSLMGTAPDDDRFVVITDGQELMHLVLMWRDEIPADWSGLPDRDRRIACEIPVTFGDPGVQRSLSEQSVLVRGHEAVVVNNLMQADPVLGRFPEQIAPFSQLFSGIPGNAPTGVEKFRWDPAARTCEVAWARPDLAIPNGIPTMSVDSGMFYGIGARNDVWTLEGIDWETGEQLLTVETTAFPMENSFYAATTVGPDGTVWTGNFGGITRFAQCDPATSAACGRRLNPVDAIYGPVPTDPQALIRDTIGLANDEPQQGNDPASDSEPSTDPAAAPASDENSLPETGGGLAGTGLLAVTAAATGRLRRRGARA